MPPRTTRARQLEGEELGLKDKPRTWLQGQAKFFPPAAGVPPPRSLRKLEHSVDRDARGAKEGPIHLEARIEIAEREVHLLERVLFHERALVACAVRFGRRR